MDRTWLKSNQGIGVLLALFFVGIMIYLEFKPWSHVILRDGFTLGFLPRVSTGLLIIFSAIMTFDKHRRVVLGKTEQIRFTALLNTVIISATCYAFFYLMRLVGFLLVAPFFLVLSIRLFGIKSWKTSVITALVITVVIYGIFRLLGIPLPAGILPMD
jgi:hypothetical protein